MNCFSEGRAGEQVKILGSCRCNGVASLAYLLGNSNRLIDTAQRASGGSLDTSARSLRLIHSEASDDDGLRVKACGEAHEAETRAGGQDTRARPGAHRVDGQRPSTPFPPFSFMQSPESETFDSVHWETVPSTSSPSLAAVSAQEEEDLDPGRLFAERLHLEDAAHAAGGESSSKWNGWLSVRIVDYKKELENGKESYVTYGVEMKVRGRCPRSSSVRVASETSGAVISLADKLLSCPLVPLPLDYSPLLTRMPAFARL